MTPWWVVPAALALYAGFIFGVTLQWWALAAVCLIGLLYFACKGY